MKTRTFTIGIAAFCFVVFSGSVTWAGGVFRDRQVRQHNRIGQGLRNGEITGNEYARLTKEQLRIQRTKKRAWADDRIDFKERRRLRNMQDRASNHISRAKHNPRRVWHKQHKRWDHKHHRPYYKHSRYRWHNGRHHRHDVAYPRSHVSGLMADPGWLFAWSVALD